jgi:hypothetical protein
MDGKERRTRFEERVRIERSFLVPVNRRFGSAAPLAGMTQNAIESWELRASEVFVDVDIGRLAALLREAAQRAELLADNSREVFAADRRVEPDALDTLSKMLTEALG